MNGIISTEINDLRLLKSRLESFPSMNGLDLAKEVTTPKKYLWSKKRKSKFKVAAIDFGIKYHILKLLEEHGCQPSVV